MGRTEGENVRRWWWSLLVVGAVAVSGMAPVRAAAHVSPVRPPVLTGVYEVGQTMHVTAGRWSVEGTAVSFQWYLGRTAVTGATGQSFTLPPAAQGRKVSVRVTGTVDAYNPFTYTGTAGLAPVAARGTCPTVATVRRLSPHTSRVYGVYCGRPWAIGDVLLGRGPHAIEVVEVYRRVADRWRNYPRAKVTCPTRNPVLWIPCNVD